MRSIRLRQLELRRLGYKLLFNLFKEFIMKLKCFTMLFLGCLFSLFSCKKDFLEKKPDLSLVVPHTLNDLQLLLDNNLVMNTSPAISLIASDDFYTTDAAWQALSSAIQRNSYIWAREVYEGGAVGDWSSPYAQIFYANVVLAQLEKIELSPANKLSYEKVKGAALFYRAHAFYQLAQLFAPPYEPTTADQTLGIILRLDPDVNLRPARSTLKESYQQIISDLSAAEKLLPLQSAFKTQPSRWAAYGLLARVSHTMQEYGNAARYASNALEISATLLDYNTLNTAAPSPFPTLTATSNSEIIYYSTLLNYSFLTNQTTMVNPEVYASYGENDLRKSLFFNNRGNGVITFKGSYSGGTAVFSGLSTDELYLIRAECYARSNNSALAMADLNTLLKSRWKKGTFVDFSVASADAALEMVIRERRKQLFARGLRWTDLKRLNQEPRFAVELKRRVLGVDYSLEPNSLRYTFALPMDEINEKVIQNSR